MGLLITRDTVWVAVIDPQASMGGFEWRHTEAEARAAATELERQDVPLLGVVETVIFASPDDYITEQVDAMLCDLEAELGYDPS